MQIRLSIAIQHHPSRSDLLCAFEGMPHEVVTDPDPTARHKIAWRTYRRCMELTPEDCTHRLVLQDDATPCPGFYEAAQLACAARPDRMIAFFMPNTHRKGSRLLMEACQNDESFCEIPLGEWLPVVAMCWPVATAHGFVRWANEKGYRAEMNRADDAIVGRYATYAGVPALATVPSLVEHTDQVPSLTGNPTRVRSARCYVGDGAAGVIWR